ncbi:16S rRNA (guanine(966)-N(2))-methyltransferase RsmD [Proteinivorax tanatarense]|uniref:16S rRNA (Guanine(966)-N(2))-methyltransferase RsmD n=1 Tax=Proteinivorax tanatarense TaxID=1260629 RepID=A0AAU7VQS5_9FIRM
MVKSKSEVIKMRVIAGEKKGFPIKNIKGHKTRPTSDKVKGSIFNMIAPYIDENSMALDCFAGSGSLGIEFLSRGGTYCRFIEKNFQSYRCIKENLTRLGFDKNKFDVVKGDVFKVTLKIEKFNCIFIDPPYNQGLAQKMLETVFQKQLLCTGGIAIVEHSKEEPVLHNQLMLIKQKGYGDTSISIYTTESYE